MLCFIAFKIKCVYEDLVYVESETSRDGIFFHPLYHIQEQEKKKKKEEEEEEEWIMNCEYILISSYAR